MQNTRLEIRPCTIARGRMLVLLECGSYFATTVNVSIFRIEDHQTALELLETFQTSNAFEDTSPECKESLTQNGNNYNHVPQVPSDEMIAIVEHSPACAVLAPRLEPGNDDFILHHALAAHCPLSSLKLLCKSFRTKCSNSMPMVVCLYTLLYNMVLVRPFDYSPLRIRQQCTFADPVTGRLPIEKAILNLGHNESLGNVDAVHALLRADPAFLERID